MPPLLVLGLFEFVRGALVLSLLPLYGQDVAGFGLGVIGTAISLQYLADNACRIPAGWINDRFGGKGLILAGIFLSSIGIYLMYARWNVTFFLIGAVVFGLGVAPVWPVVIAGVASRKPVEQMGEALSKVFVAWLVGGGLGPVVINFIVGRSFGYAFIVLAGAMFIALISAFWSDFHRPDQVGHSPFSTQEFIQEFVSLRMIYPGMFAQTMSLGLLMPIVAIYARLVFGLDAAHFNLFLIGGGAFTVLLLVPAGRVADRMGVKPPLIGGLLVASISLLLLPEQKYVVNVLFLGALIGIAYSFILPSWNGLLARVVSPEKRGTMWAFFMTIEGLGMAAGAYVSGIVWENFGHGSPFFASALLLGIMAVFYSLGNVDNLVKIDN
ncbi:MAG TPA: MFS transporter [Syntrophomonadaceae bacterium]|nr:MFS transporter [Syntrophomonadaceae bacterium]